MQLEKKSLYYRCNWIRKQLQKTFYSLNNMEMSFYKNRLACATKEEIEEMKKAYYSLMIYYVSFPEFVNLKEAERNDEGAN